MVFIQDMCISLFFVILSFDNQNIFIVASNALSFELINAKIY